MTSIKTPSASAKMQEILAKARAAKAASEAAAITEATPHHTTATSAPAALAATTPTNAVTLQAKVTTNDTQTTSKTTQTKAQALQEKIAAIRLEKQKDVRASRELTSSATASAASTATTTTGTTTTGAILPSSQPLQSAAAKEQLPTQGAAKTVASSDLLAKLKLAVAVSKQASTPKASAPSVATPQAELAPTPQATQATGMGGNVITYNAEQQAFIDLAKAGKSCVLIGAAGTGKTTCSQGGIQAIIQSGLVPIIADNLSHKHIPVGVPGVLMVSFTRRAVNNIRKVQPADLKSNCITAHKLLEYQPEYFVVEDPITGVAKNKMQFLPNRNAVNPLPNSITVVVIEEASMLSVELFLEVVAALPNPRKTQFIFIGDIQQLPPVFGSAILGFSLLSLPVVELKTVYRQALESPIIRLAHRILSGKPIKVAEYPEWKEEGKLTIHPWKKKLAADLAATTLAAFFKAAIDNNQYLPNEDMILIPYNKGCGTIEVNAHIANHLARKREAVTYEVMAGYNKHYFSVGDRVLYEKEDAEIVSIEPNGAYNGTKVQAPSVTLDYWGYNPNAAEDAAKLSKNYGMQGAIDVDKLLSQMASDSEERVTQASHSIVVRLSDSERDVTLNTSAEINAMLHSYALTVHKSQGSEWRKVFVCLHQSHNTMLQRELLYTAVTRAKEELYVICEPESFTKGIISQRIVGETLEQKAEFFKGKQQEGCASSDSLNPIRKILPMPTLVSLGLRTD